MRSRYVFLVCLIFAAGTGLSAFEWPVESRILTATFGDYRWGGFHPGIDIAGGEQDVHPSDTGELIYYEEEHAWSGMLPSGLGSFAVIEHERGLRTLYGHLKPGSLAAPDTVGGPKDVLARVGSSGMAVGPRLHFQVIDGEFNQFVNPLLILPPLKDTTKPVLEAVYALRDRSLYELKDRSTLPSGAYQLLLELYDPSEYVRYSLPLNPYRIQVFLNGEQVAHVSFKALQPEDGNMLLIQSDKAAADDFYYDDRTIKLGPLQFSTGDLILEVLAEDISRNSITREIRIRVVE